MHKTLKLVVFQVISLVVGCGLSLGAQAEEVTFKATDGSTVYADEYLTEAGKSAPLIILFHQAGANGRTEYQNTAPRFQEAGFNVMVVDLRSGGDRFGGNNRTVDARGESTGYCEAYPDLEAAINYADLQGYSGPVFAVGSSYSAALVVKLGAEYRSNLNGVVAFSPASGGPMADCSPNEYASTTKTPTMIVRPGNEMEYDSVKAQFALFEQEGHTMYVHEKGVHGSSTLDPNRAKEGSDGSWKAVMAFLAENQ